MRILVLAGGADQIALINELKSRGHYVVLVDFFHNPPAKQFADKHIIASTLDIVGIRNIAINENVNLLCTACTDQALLSVAKVSEDLGLPCYLSYQTALNVTNKSYMKRVLMDNGIPTAKYVVLDDVDFNAIMDFRLPLVVKPVDCNSSKGVKRIDSVDEFENAIEDAIRLSRTNTAIVEEFIEGKELSVDFYIENGAAKYLSATTSMKIKNRKSFTILCSDYPAVTREQELLLQKIGNDIAKAFYLDDCPMFMQVVANGNDINVIEFSARMGGGSKYNLIRVLSGVDIMSKYVDRVLGGKPSVYPSKQVNFCKMIYLYCYPGIFDHIEGLDELKHNNVVDEYFLYKTPGMEILHSETSSDRPAGYLITADTEQELVRKIKLVDSRIKVVSAEGKDIMIHNLL